MCPLLVPGIVRAADPGHTAARDSWYGAKRPQALFCSLIFAMGGGVPPVGRIRHGELRTVSLGAAGAGPGETALAGLLSGHPVALPRPPATEGRPALYTPSWTMPTAERVTWNRDMTMRREGAEWNRTAGIIAEAYSAAVRGRACVGRERSGSAHTLAPRVRRPVYGSRRMEWP